MILASDPKRDTRPDQAKREKPINKRPGRVVCICTAKGKIVYTESEFERRKRR